MARTLFISETYVKKNSQIDENVDVKLIRPTIWDAQQDHILPILGTDLYDELIAAIDADSLTADQTTLINTYIAEALIKWVVFEFVVIGNYKYRNKAITKSNSENSQSVDYTEDRYLKDYWSHKAEVRGERLRKYLCANTDIFPAYLSNSDIDDIRPSETGYRPSIYLGTGRKLNCDYENET